MTWLRSIWTGSRSSGWSWRRLNSENVHRLLRSAASIMIHSATVHRRAAPGTVIIQSKSRRPTSRLCQLRFPANGLHRAGESLPPGLSREARLRRTPFCGDTPQRPVIGGGCAASLLDLLRGFAPRAGKGAALRVLAPPVTRERVTGNPQKSCYATSATLALAILTLAGRQGCMRHPSPREVEMQTQNEHGVYEPERTEELARIGRSYAAAKNSAIKELLAKFPKGFPTDLEHVRNELAALKAMVTDTFRQPTLF